MQIAGRKGIPCLVWEGMGSRPGSQYPVMKSVVKNHLFLLVRGFVIPE